MSLPAALSHYLSHRPQRIALLQHIAEQGSITRAAKAAGLSYKGAWDAIDELNNLAARPLVERSVGGRGGGGARLSEDGQRLLRLYQRLQALQAQVLEAAEDSADIDLLGRLVLQTSARNQLAGTVACVEEDGTYDRVHLDLGGGLHIRADITRESTHRLHLTPGTHVVALMKAGWLTVHDLHAPWDRTVNRLAAQVDSIEPTDAGSSEVRMNLPNGQTLCALVDNTTRNTLRLENGTQVAVSFEPGSVLLGRPF